MRHFSSGRGTMTFDDEFLDPFPQSRRPSLA
jgi:hypothetical protein